MWPAKINKDTTAILILIALLIAWCLSAPVLSRCDGNTQELELLFDPDLLKQRIRLTDDYGERPLPPPLPPNNNNPYQPDLEDEYY